jgi:L-lactate dehydrogenase complex protein LldG
MDSKESILSNIRKNIHHTYERPTIDIKAVVYNDPVTQFVNISKTVGGEAIIVDENERIDDLIKTRFPDAKTFASNIPEIKIATINPDTVERPQDLNGTDVGIVKGMIGVAENGCVWIEQDVKEKAVYFIAEQLVIILPRTNIVNNMHEAYRKIQFGKYNFGTFISGPSKTADIEQAMGKADR